MTLRILSSALCLLCLALAALRIIRPVASLDYAEEELGT